MPSLSQYLEYNDPLTIIWRKGTVEDPYVDRIDSLPVINNQITLLEIPDPFAKVLISGYTEISQDTFSKKKTIESNEFLVNYQNGNIQFNPSEEGKTLVETYKGRGLIMYPASRIYAMISRNPDVVQSLQDIIEEALEKIADAEVSITNVDAAIANSVTATSTANTATDNANIARDACYVAITAMQTATATAITEMENATATAIADVHTQVDTAVTDMETDVATALANNETAINNSLTGMQTQVDTAIDNTETAIANAETATENANNAADSAITIQKAPVPLFADIATTYPSPLNGWRVMVESTGDIFRYDGITLNDWVFYENWTGGSVPYANDTTNGLLTANDFNKIHQKLTAKTIIFILGSITDIGVQRQYISFPVDGVITGVLGVCSTAGSNEETLIKVQKISAAQLAVSGTWIDVLTSPMILPQSANLATPPTIAVSTVADGDYFRIVIETYDTTMKGLTVQIEVTL